MENHSQPNDAADDADPTADVRIRGASPNDRPAVLAMWPGGLVHPPMGAETGSWYASLIEAALAGRHRLFVAESAGVVVGSVAVIRLDDLIAHLCGLCVTRGGRHRDHVARLLGQTAVAWARESGYLKIAVHTPEPPTVLTPSLHQLGFEYSRPAVRDGVRVLEFYRNLYEQPALGQPDEANGTVPDHRFVRTG